MAELVEVIQADNKVTPEMLAAWCSYEPVGVFKETMSFARFNGMLAHAFYSGWLSSRPPASGVAEEGWRPIEEAGEPEWPDWIIVGIWTEYGWAMGSAYWHPNANRWVAHDFNPRNQDLRLRKPTHFLSPDALPAPPALVSGERP